MTRRFIDNLYVVHPSYGEILQTARISAALTTGVKIPPLALGQGGWQVLG